MLRIDLKIQKVEKGLERLQLALTHRDTILSVARLEEVGMAEGQLGSESVLKAMNAP